MTYEIVKTEQNVFDILEIKTKQVLNVSKKELDARILCKKLNKGYGFNGFTPTFFTELKGLQKAKR